jgi:DNA-binding CsgD family transcriptional regulator
VRDPVGVIENAYSGEGDTESRWLARVASEIRANLTESSAPMLAWTYQIKPDGYVELVSVAEEPAGISQRFFPVQLSSDEQNVLAQFHRATGLGSGYSQLVKPFAKEGNMFAYYERTLLSHGWADMITLNSVDAAGRGCMVGLPTKDLVRGHRSSSVLWARVSAHIATGLRLRRKLAAMQTPAESVAAADAILTPGGHVEHALGSATSQTARDSLKAGARAIERARGPLRRRDPSEAIEVWRGLVSGLWSLVDHFDTDGRRYLVAHRNDATTVDPRALTERERQVVAYADLGQSNKLIAYQLGLSASTVAVHLGRAREKMRGVSREGVKAGRDEGR